MKAKRTLSIVCCHAEGEVGDVIIGGVLDIPATSMHSKLLMFMDKHDGLRKLVHYEPRGRLEMSTMIITAPCDPRADVGFLIMAPGDWVPMSGSNTICTTTGTYHLSLFKDSHLSCFGMFQDTTALAS